MLRTFLMPLTLFALAGSTLLTGCATQTSTPHRRAIEPSWTYHDTPDPLAYNVVRQQPAGIGDGQVAHVPDRFDGINGFER